MYEKGRGKGNEQWYRFPYPQMLTLTQHALPEPQVRCGGELVPEDDDLISPGEVLPVVGLRWVGITEARAGIVRKRQRHHAIPLLVQNGASARGTAGFASQDGIDRTRVQGTLQVRKVLRQIHGDGRPCRKGFGVSERMNGLC